jgi:hypothetical protein
MPIKGRTLIATDTAMAAALIGALVESAGGQPLFLQPDEPLSEAIVRLRPLRIALISVELSEARSDLFFALAERHGSRVVVFGSDHQFGEIADVASRREIAWFSVPPTREAIVSAIDVRPNRRSATTDDRRQSPHASRASDGTPILVDHRGTHWLVYDRRGAAARRTAGATIDRTFISELGERFSCAVDSTIAGDATATTLNQQLTRARASSNL